MGGAYDRGVQHPAMLFFLLQLLKSNHIIKAWSEMAFGEGREWRWAWGEEHYCGGETSDEFLSTNPEVGIITQSNVWQLNYLIDNPETAMKICRSNPKMAARNFNSFS